MSSSVRALPARRESGASVPSVADAAAFGVLLAAVVAVPVTFSIANPDVFAMPKTIIAVGLAVLLVALLGLRWIASGSRLRDLRTSPLAWAVVACVAWNLLAFPFALDPPHALTGQRLQYQGLGTTLGYVVYLVAAWTTVRGSARRTMLLTAAALGSIPVAGYAIVQRAGLDPIWSNLSEGRVFSAIGQANALAAYLVLVIPLTIGLVLGPRLSVQLLAAALVVLQLGALAFTLSRGGFLGAGAATAVLLAVLWPRRRHAVTRRAATLGAVAVAAVLATAVALPQTRAAADRTLDRVMLIHPGESSARMHLDLWAVGLAIIADHPLVGRGQDSYVFLFHDYREEVLAPDRAELLSRRGPESPHNHYLAVAGGAGLPALVAYLAIIWLAAWRTVAGMRRADDIRIWMLGGCLLAAVAAHLVTDAFMTAETTGATLFWIVLGAAAALDDDGCRAAQVSAGEGVRGSRSLARRFHVS